MRVSTVRVMFYTAHVILCCSANALVTMRFGWKMPIHTPFGQFLSICIIGECGPMLIPNELVVTCWVLYLSSASCRENLSRNEIARVRQSGLGSWFRDV